MEICKRSATVKPTKVRGNPTMINKPDGTGRLTLINTDAGYFTISQLAAHIGISKDGLCGRVERFGWHSQRIWEPLHTECMADETGNAEYKALSEKSRKDRLALISRPGKYDYICSNGCDNVLEVCR